MSGLRYQSTQLDGDDVHIVDQAQAEDRDPQCHSGREQSIRCHYELHLCRSKSRQFPLPSLQSSADVMCRVYRSTCARSTDPTRCSSSKRAISLQAPTTSSPVAQVFCNTSSYVFPSPCTALMKRRRWLSCLDLRHDVFSPLRRRSKSISEQHVSVIAKSSTSGSSARCVYPVRLLAAFSRRSSSIGSLLFPNPRLLHLSVRSPSSSLFPADYRSQHQISHVHLETTRFRRETPAKSPSQET